MARLKEQYVNEIAPALNKKFGYKSVMQIPKLDIENKLVQVEEEQLRTQAPGFWDSLLHWYPVVG